MILTIQTMTEAYLEKSLDMVQKVFTEYDSEAEGKLVRALVEEIRSKRFYMPELEFIAVDEQGEVAGYAMFSGFHLEGKFEDKLLILTPVAVRTELQRRHISKRMLEYGFDCARRMGYEAVIVEGNPANYRSRGFVTAAVHGILPGKSVDLPHIDCLMVKELKQGALEYIKGNVEYSDYQTLT